MVVDKIHLISYGKSLKDVLHYLQQEVIKKLYPHLSKLAVVALTMPMSTAEVEHLFSIIKRVSFETSNDCDDK